MKKTVFKIILVFSVALFSGCFGGGATPKSKHLSAGGVESARGMTFLNKGCYKKALDCFFRAQELHTSVGQTRGAAMSLNNLGEVYKIISDPKSSEAFFQESLFFYGQLEDGEGMRRVYVNLAALYIDKGQYKKAGDYLNKAIKIKIEKEKKPFVPILISQGVLNIKTGDYKTASISLNKALEASPPENLPEMAAIWFSLGVLNRETGKYGIALDYFNKALSADRERGFYKGIADDFAELGKTSEKTDKKERAVFYFKQAAGIYALLELPEQTDGIMKRLSKLVGKDVDSLEITEFFVSRWLDGKGLTAPCR